MPKISAPFLLKIDPNNLLLLLKPCLFLVRKQALKNLNYPKVNIPPPPSYPPDIILKANNTNGMYRETKNNKRSGENGFTNFWIEEQILFTIFKPDSNIDLPAAKKIVTDRLNLQEGKAYPVLCDINGIIKIEKPARYYLASSGLILVKAVSFVTSPPVALAALRFYLKTNNVNVPTHFSTDRTQGLKHLAPYLKFKM